MAYWNTRKGNYNYYLDVSSRKVVYGMDENGNPRTELSNSFSQRDFLGRYCWNVIEDFLGKKVLQEVLQEAEKYR